MKKKFMMLFSICAIALFPGIANAASISVGLNCSTVTLGQTTTCTITGTSSEPVSAVSAKIAVSGGIAISGTSKGGAWSGAIDASSIDVYAENNASGTFTIGTLTVSGNAAGTGTITISGVKCYDANYTEFSGTGTTKNLSVVTTTTTTKLVTEATTTTTTTRLQTVATTTKATQKITNNKTTATTNNNINNRTTTQTSFVEPIEVVTTIPITELLKLTSVTVDDFNVTYTDGKYYTTVNPDTESVTVGATADEGISIVGVGKRTLMPGKNVVELILRKDSGESRTVQVIITKPEDTAEHDTSLSDLKVVNYPLTFKADVYEYTITVPYDVKEVYVIGETYNRDASITGTGVNVITKENNNIYVKVSYGDIASTEYVIHVKKDYKTLIFMILTGLFGAGLIGLGGFSVYNKKKAVSQVVNEKNAAIAEANRTLSASAPEANVQVNGQNVVGVGARPVIPAKVVEAKQVANAPKVVTVNKVVATQSPAVAENAPQAQVKVVKTTSVPVQTVTTVNTQSVSTQQAE